MHTPLRAARPGGPRQSAASLPSSWLKRLLAAGLLVLLGGTSAWAQLTGSKSIPGDYPTLSAAITDLNTAGVGAGGVTFDVAAGYTETAVNLTITASGTAANPIVFRKAGTGANPLLTAGAGSSAATDALIRLAGADYVTFEGIDVAESAANTTATTQLEFGYALFRASATDGSQNNVIRNCVVTLNKTNTATIGIAGLAVTTAGTATTASSPAGANSGNLVYGNVVTNATKGIDFSASTSTTIANYDQNNWVGQTATGAAAGNFIGNFGGTATGWGIGANYQNGFKAVNNTINSTLNYTSATASTPVAASTVTSTLRGIFANTGTSATLDITGNLITLASGGTTTALTGIENGIGSTAASNTVNITNNTVTGCTYATATTGAFTGITNSATPATLNINGNTVSNNVTPGTGAMTLISNTGVLAAMVMSISNNTITGNSKTPAGTTGAIGLTGIITATATTTMSGNTITNNTIVTSGTSTSTCTLQGMSSSASSTPVETLTGNVITGLSISGSSTSTSHVVRGILTSNNGSSNVQTLTGNVIGGLAIGTGSGSVTGISVPTGGGTGSVIGRNKLYDLSATGAGASVTGLLISSGGTYAVVNNLIGDLRAPAATGLLAVSGLQVAGSTAVNAYYNTLYLNASSTGATFGTSGIYLNTTSTTLDLRNNLVVNKSAANGTGGYTVALRRSSGTAGTAPANLAAASNNNLYYAGAPGATNLIYLEGAATATNAQQTIGGYRAFVAGRESLSGTEDAPFLSTSGADATFLHLNPSVPTLAEGRAQPLSSVSTDFDQQTRSTSTPDIGADEGAFTSGVPAVDVAAVGLAAPLTTGCYGSAEAVTVTIRNNGGQALNFAATPATVTVVVGGTATQTLTTTINTGTLAVGATQTVTVGTLNMTAAGSYTFAITATGTGDGDTSNDTNSATRTVAPTVALPQNVDFTGFTGSNLTTVFPNWYEATGATAPVAAGAAWLSATGLGSATNVTAKLNLYTNSRNEWIVGPKVAATANTRLLFRAAITDFNSTTAPAGAGDGMTGTDDAVRVMVSTDCGVSFTEVFRVDVTNAPSPTTVAFVDYTVPLGAYAGQNIIVAFKATDGPLDDAPDYDFHLDDITLNEAAASDAGITALTEPGTLGCYGATQNVTVTIRNYGTADLSNVPVRVAVGGPVTQTLTGTFTGTIPAGGTANFTVGQLNMTAAGTYTFDASTQLGGDANATNDALAQQTRSIAPVAAQGQVVTFTGFTGSNLATVFPGWTEATGATRPSGTTSAWTNTSFPAGNTTAKVNLYSNSKAEWIVSPKFLATGSTVLTFSAGISEFADTTPDPAGMTGTDDFVEVRISTDCGQTFSRIPSFAAFNAGNQPSNGSLSSYSIDLSSYAGQNIIVGFFASEGTADDTPDYDFHIDNLRVNSPVTIDLTATALVAPTTTQGCYSTAETVTVAVSNVGTQTLDFAANPATVTAVVTVPGGSTQTLTTTVTTGTLAVGATQNVALAPTLDMSAAGSYSFALTGTVQGDLNPGNDALTQAVTRTVTAPVVGTVSPSTRTLCGSGPATLTLSSAANGSIQWQQSSDNATFTDVAGATALALTTPALTQTTYFRAQVRCNAAVATSNVATVTVSSPQVASTNGPVTICAGTTATLTATAAATGSTLRFYDAATGGTALATGGSFTTPALTTSRQYFVEAVNAITETVGRPAPASSSNTTASNYGLVFNATNAFTLYSVDVYPTSTAGNLVVQVQDNAGTLIPGLTATVAVPAGTSTNPVPFTVPLNFSIPAGTGMRLIAVSSPSLVRESSIGGFPYNSTPSGNVSITSGYLTSTSTNYYFFYNWQVSGECASSRTAIQVDVTTPATADFSYAASPYCTTAAAATPTLAAGATAGTFSSTTGLSLNATTGAIDPAASTPGTYTVTNTVAAAGGCGPVTATATVTITAPQTAGFSYAASSYCTTAAAATPALATGATAGTFSSTNGLTLDAATGAITPGTSTPGTYTVTNTVAASGGCAAVASTATVTITAPQTAGFSYAAATACAGAPGTLAPTLAAGATAGSFSSTTGLSLNAATGAITPSTSVAGTYTVTNTVAASGGCAAVSSTATVTINAAPAQPTVAVAYTTPGTAVLTASAAPAGAAYQWYVGSTAIAGATGQSYTANGTAQPGAYTVVVTSAQGCASPASAALTVTATSKPLAGSSLRLFPNPTHDGQLTLELRGYPQAVELTVLNALGQVVYHQAVPAGRTQQALDLRHLARGVYTLRATTAGGSDTRRFVRE
jgi:hypothetical protein